MVRAERQFAGWQFAITALTDAGAPMATAQVVTADGALVLTAHRGLGGPFLDHFALIDPGRGHRTGCLEAARRRRLVVSDDTALGRRFDDATRAVLRDEGVRSSFSSPVISGDELVGVVSAHFRSPLPPHPERITSVAGAVGSLVGLGLEHADRRERLEELVDDLERALESRDLIGQAKGVLMARHKLTADEAFDLLRAASNHRNEKLRDVAEQVARTGTLGLGTSSPSG